MVAVKHRTPSATAPATTTTTWWLFLSMGQSRRMPSNHNSQSCHGPKHVHYSSSEKPLGSQLCVFRHTKVCTHGQRCFLVLLLLSLLLLFYGENKFHACLPGHVLLWKCVSVGGYMATCLEETRKKKKNIFSNLFFSSLYPQSAVFLWTCWFIPEKPKTQLFQHFTKTTLGAKCS